MFYDNLVTQIGSENPDQRQNYSFERKSQMGYARIPISRMDSMDGEDHTHDHRVFEVSCSSVASFSFGEIIAENGRFLPQYYRVQVGDNGRFSNISHDKTQLNYTYISSKLDESFA